MTRPRYAHYYLALSILSTLLFGGTIVGIGPLESLTPTQSTGIVIVSFTILTIIQSLSGS